MLSPRESRRKGSSWRRLRDRLRKGDPYLTEIIVSADEIIDDDDEDDENVYEFLAQHLPKNTTITTISITEVEDPDEQSIASFVSALPKSLSTSLQSLSLVRVDLEEQDLSAIATVIPQLEALQVLNLEGNGIGGSENESSFESLCLALKEGQPPLRVLNLKDNEINDSGAKILAEHVLSTNGEARRIELSSFSIGPCLGKEGVRSICKSLAASHHSQHLQTLDLSGNKRGGVDLATALASVLPSLRSLQCLFLNNTSIGPRGTKTLLSTIAKHQREMNLRELHLAGCRVGFFGAKAVQAIGLPPSLEVLNLGNNAITNDGVWQLSSVVASLEKLRVLNLSSNQLGDDSASELARTCLPALSRSLITLDLSGNKDIGDNGAEVLAESLRRSSDTVALCKLILTYNSIGNVGASALGALLGECSVVGLVELDLNGNKVGDEGAVALAKGIETNTLLTHLNLKANNIGDEGAAEFVDSLDHNTTLLSLDLTHNSVSSSRTMVLDMLLKHRTPAKPIEETTNNILKDESSHAEEQQHASASSQLSLNASLENIAYNNAVMEQNRKDLVQAASVATNPPAKISHQYAAYCTEKFNLRHLLNYGSFGDLFEGFDVENGQRYALRRVLLSDAGVLGEMRSRTIDELATLKVLEKDNGGISGALPLVGYALENAQDGGSTCVLVYGIGNQSTLNEWIADVDKRRSMPWKIRVQILKDIVSVVDFLHKGSKDKKIRPSFHGDIKSANVFVDDNDQRAKLIDCGVSRVVATDRARFQRGEVVFGTRGYRCPRYERGQKYAAHSDVFSFGIVMSEIIGGKLQGNVDESSGKEQDYYYQSLLERRISVDPLGGPIHKAAIAALCKVAMSCMNSEPSRRPTASELQKILDRWHM